MDGLIVIVVVFFFFLVPTYAMIRSPIFNRTTLKSLFTRDTLRELIGFAIFILFLIAMSYLTDFVALLMQGLIDAIKEEVFNV